MAGIKTEMTSVDAEEQQIKAILRELEHMPTLPTLKEDQTSKDTLVSFL